MKFLKFAEWVSIKEAVIGTAQAQGAQAGRGLMPNIASTKVKKAIASTVGMDANKRKITLKKLADDSANDPSMKPKDIAAIAAAAEEV